MEYIRVHYKKSSIGYNQRQKDTVKSLGLRKLGQSKIHRATPQVLGMCRHVQHLVEWAEVDKQEALGQKEGS